MVEFVEEWFIEQTLGEGAFGEVKLLINRKSKDEVAMKIINIKENPEALDIVKKEVGVHRLLNHENIIRFYGHRREGNIEYMFLEYASGGELFDRIEPDVGMIPSKAHYYFRQLLSGVNYLHKLGVAHRDLKPENILLNANGVLKISDFGFATIFRTKGIERLLEKRCGTLPYVAPEVLNRPYRAQPADIWSCGIILVALLAGELPWDKPQIECIEYREWKEGKIHGLPWKKLEIHALTFVKRILCPTPSKRLTIDQIEAHAWMNKKIHNGNKINQKSHNQLTKKNISGILVNKFEEDSIACISYSQPEPHHQQEVALHDLDTDVTDAKSPFFSFSQPPGEADEYFLGSQISEVPNVEGNVNQIDAQRWVKRMTRFCVATPKEKTIKELTSTLEDMGYKWKMQVNPITSITISTVDRRKMQLVFKANIIDMSNHGNQMVLLDFRLSRGDGIEFKRHFVRIKEELNVFDLRVPLNWLN